jgi:hypothetical protein
VKHALWKSKLIMVSLHMEIIGWVIITVARRRKLALNVVSATKPLFHSRSSAQLKNRGRVYFSTPFVSLFYL